MGEGGLGAHQLQPGGGAVVRRHQPSLDRAAARVIQQGRDDLGLGVEAEGAELGLLRPEGQGHPLVQGAGMEAPLVELAVGGRPGGGFPALGLCGFRIPVLES